MRFKVTKSLCLLCACFVIFFVSTQAQSDLSQLEPDVREHIKSYQDALAATVKDPKSTETQLSAAYGALGEIYQAYSLNAPA